MINGSLRLRRCTRRRLLLISAAIGIGTSAATTSTAQVAPGPVAAPWPTAPSPSPPAAAALPAQPSPQPAYAPPPSSYSPGETPPAALGPRRQGFTLELGLGAALTRVSTDVVTGCVGNVCNVATFSESTVSETRFGLAPLSIGLGGFLTPQVALLFRTSSTSFFENDDQWTNTLVGGAVQYWPADLVFVGAGFGLATFGRSAWFPGSSADTRKGYGFSARAGLSVGNWTHHNLRVSLEVIPSFFEASRVLGSAIAFEWQYF